MEPLILQVHAHVEIAAPPASVFALVSDLDAKTRLNPVVRVIRIERETPGPLREGSVTYLRLQKGTRIYEHRSRCQRIEPDRLLEGQAILPTLLRVRVQLAPIPEGTRLTQQEECEVTPEMLEGLPVSRRAERAWKLMKSLHFIAPELAQETYGLILRERAASLRVHMQGELQAWLHAIRDHMESCDHPGPSVDAAPNPSTDTGGAGL